MGCQIFLILLFILIWQHKMFNTPFQPSLKLKSPTILKVQRSGFLIQVDTNIDNTSTFGGTGIGSFSFPQFQVQKMEYVIIRRFNQIYRVLAGKDLFSTKSNGDNLWMHVNWQDNITTDDEKFDLLEDHIKNGTPLPADTWIKLSSNSSESIFIKHTYSTGSPEIKDILITGLSKYKISNDGSEQFLSYPRYTIFHHPSLKIDASKLIRIRNFGFPFRVVNFNSEFIKNNQEASSSSIIGNGFINKFFNYPNLETVSLDLFNTNTINYNPSHPFSFLRNFFIINENKLSLSNLFTNSNSFFGFTLPIWNDTTLINPKPWDCAGAFQNTSYNNNFVCDWDMSECEFTTNMFRNCQFNQNINNWDVRSVKDMSFMFLNNTNFNQPINNWNLKELSNAVEFMSGKSWEDFTGSNETEKKQNATDWLDSIYLSWPRKIKLNSNVNIDFGNIPYSYHGIGSYSNIDTCGRSVLTNRESFNDNPSLSSYIRENVEINTRDDFLPGFLIQSRRVRAVRNSPFRADYPNLISINKDFSFPNGNCNGLILKGLYKQELDPFSFDTTVFILEADTGFNVMAPCGGGYVFGTRETIFDGLDWFVKDGGFLIHDTGEIINQKQYISLAFLGSRNRLFNLPPFPPPEIHTIFPYPVNIIGPNPGEFIVTYEPNPNFFNNMTVKVSATTWPLDAGIYFFKVRGIERDFEFECRVRIF
jgi:hypothetical protein